MAGGTTRAKVALMACAIVLQACVFDPTLALPGRDGHVPDADAGPACGNGLVETGEECDDGNPTPGDGCSRNCEVEPGWSCEGSPSICKRKCGNGQIDPGEECDGQDLGGQTCVSLNQGFTGGELRCGPACRFDTTGCVSPTCGNGRVDAPNEECDDGNQDNTDACLANCRAATCGDGYVWAGHEDCDTGGLDTRTCDSDCTRPECGDGHQNGLAHEDCDPGTGTDTEDCDFDCTLPVCGDRHVNERAGEECDEGRVDTPTCDSDCTHPECGDGHTNPAVGEQCDDGNTDNTDACLNTCEPARCGDGFVWLGHEQCDDGNTDNTDACLSTCELARCGDGFVWANREECDSGGQDTRECDFDCTRPVCGDGHTNRAAGEECDESGQDTSTCDSDCSLPACGDGHVNPEAGEECDDGNTTSGDGCDSSCHVEGPVCGNGVVEQDEECDDGNTFSNDGCDSDCEVEDYSACPPEGGRCVCVVYVDADATGDDNGKNWEDAFTDLHDGLAKAGSRAPCEVWIAEGTYFGGQDGFAIPSNVSVFGSFPRNARWRDERNVVATPSVLDGADQSDSVVLFWNVSNALIDSVQVVRGAATPLHHVGGGIYVGGPNGCSDITMSRLSVAESSADAMGGGIYIGHGSTNVLMDRVTVQANETLAGEGGGIAVDGSSSAELVNSFVLANRTTNGVGRNVVVTAGSTLTIRNCDVLLDQSVVLGSNVSVDGEAVVVNSILWGGSGTVQIANPGRVTASYSDIRGQAGLGPGVISQNPRFVNPANGVLELGSDSPCIDAADGDEAPALDAHGRSRYDDPNHSNTGRGNPDYTDMGALEFQG